MSDGNFCRFCGDPALIEQIDALNIRLTALEAENAQLREAARWIPVSERLPEGGVTVITLNAMYSAAPVGPARYCHDRELWEDLEVVDNDGGYFDLIKVTHWMPLPSPPAEQQEGGE